MKEVKFSVIFLFVTLSIIFASYGGNVFAQTKLRNTSAKLNKGDIETLEKKLNLFDKKLNEQGDFPNDFVDNGDGTVTDRATGLMWEKEGSSKEGSYNSANKHVKSLNKKKFAGHNDWRLPTIEELYSLLEPNAEKQRYIHPVFASKPSACWSTDTSDLPVIGAVTAQRKLTIDYKEGTVSDAYSTPITSGASGFQITSSFTRAVRSLE